MEHKNARKKADSTEVFEKEKISKVVIQNSIPALIAMVMVMVYNLADTFFLGLTRQDLRVTAVSLATPLFMVFMSLGTLFGVGGTSVISRALGRGDREYAKKACSFCMWACIAVGGVLSVLGFIFAGDIAVMLGASGESLEMTEDYLRITAFCGVFSMISNCFSNVLRAEGQPMKAMTGTLIGNLLNLILDPVMILALDWGVAGAAVATVIGNAVAAGFYLMWFLSGRSALSIRPRNFSCRDGILTGVLSVGISASLANLLVSLSSIVVNNRLSGYEAGDMLVAGYGVTAKVMMIVTLIGIGIGSGVQPFLGYLWGAGLKERLRKGIRFSVLFATVFCLIVAALCYAFAEPVVRVFLTDADALDSGVRFTRILMSTAWLIGAFAICQNTLQAVGAALPALLASLFRQGILFIPAVFLMEKLTGMDGLVWAQPVADVLSIVLVAVMMACMLNRKDGAAVKRDIEKI